MSSVPSNISFFPSYSSYIKRPGGEVLNILVWKWPINRLASRISLCFSLPSFGHPRSPLICIGFSQKSLMAAASFNLSLSCAYWSSFIGGHILVILAPPDLDLVGDCFRFIVPEAYQGIIFVCPHLLLYRAQKAQIWLCSGLVESAT